MSEFNKHPLQTLWRFLVRHHSTGTTSSRRTTRRNHYGTKRPTAESSLHLGLQGLGKATAVGDHAIRAMHRILITVAVLRWVLCPLMAFSIWGLAKFFWP